MCATSITSNSWDVRAEFDDVLARLRETPAPPQEKG